MSQNSSILIQYGRFFILLFLFFSFALFVRCFRAFCEAPQPVKLCVAATPEYFARYGKPRHPHDLLNHQCVVFRYPSGKPFHWQFAKELEIAVAGNIILDDVDAELEAVLMGAGIGYLLYEQIKEYLDTGRLECVLEDWSTERPGFQIYYPNRQYMSCGLRAFLDYVKTGQICQSQRHRPQ